jgi:hypothetical protein
MGSAKGAFSAWHVTESASIPEYPFLQKQLNDPSEFVQP